MTPAVTTRLLVAGTCAALCLTLVGVMRELVRDHADFLSRIALPGDAPTVQVAAGEMIDSLATVVSDRDPFRLSREPSEVAYAADHPPTAGAPPPPPKPTIAVTGIIGPPWAAVVEGAPGRDGGTVAKVGDTLAKAPFAVTVLRYISHDTVTLATPDTIWKLTVRPAWR